MKTSAHNIIIFFTLAMLSIGIDSYATGLKPSYNSLQTGIQHWPPYLRPMRSLYWVFEGNTVEVRPDTRIALYNEQSDTLACHTLIAQNDTVWGRYKYGYAILPLDSLTYLTKGHTYHWTIPAGCVWKKDSAEVCNEELTMEFEIPSFLPGGSVEMGSRSGRLQDGDTLSSSNYAGFNFSLTTDSLPGAHVYLRRKGRLIRTYALDPYRGDWDAGYVVAEFNINVMFEKGVEYCVQLPEGSIIGSGCRHDIFNRNIELSFIGGYASDNAHTGPKALKYDRYGFTDWIAPGCGGLLRLFYTDDVAYTDNPVAELWRQDASGHDIELWETVRPQIIEENGEWIVEALFKERPLDWRAGARYAVRIPEGTVVRRYGQPDVNPSEEIPFETAGLTATQNASVAVRGLRGAISVLGASAGTPVRVYGIDGHLVTEAFSLGTEVFTIPVFAPGVYIVVSGSLCRKVVIW